MLSKLKSFPIKKIAFTSVSIPLLYKTIWAWKWQARRKIEKQSLIDDRIKKLRNDPILITNP